MIYFDRKTLRLLRRIRRSGVKGVTWGDLEKKFGEDTANAFLLQSLSVAGYTVTKNDHGEWISDAQWNGTTNSRFRSYSSPMGNELLEKRFFDFWKWVVPTLISVSALIVSIMSLLFK